MPEIPVLITKSGDLYPHIGGLPSAPLEDVLEIARRTLACVGLDGKVKWYVSVSDRDLVFQHRVVTKNSGSFHVSGAGVPRPRQSFETLRRDRPWACRPDTGRVTRCAM